jgi:hypothetical protein
LAGGEEEEEIIIQMIIVMGRRAEDIQIPDNSSWMNRE